MAKGSRCGGNGMGWGGRKRWNYKKFRDESQAQQRGGLDQTSESGGGREGGRCPVHEMKSAPSSSLLFLVPRGCDSCSSVKFVIMAKGNNNKKKSQQPPSPTPMVLSLYFLSFHFFLLFFFYASFMNSFLYFAMWIEYWCMNMSFKRVCVLSTGLRAKSSQDYIKCQAEFTAFEIMEGSLLTILHTTLACKSRSFPSCLSHMFKHLVGVPKEKV